MLLTTYSGQGIDLLPDNINLGPFAILDIARGLSNVCRFSGQCRTFYSVAQHSVRVANCLPKQMRTWGLLHDASEAYLADMPRPVKALLPDYVALEEKVQSSIYRHFQVDTPQVLKLLLKQADDDVLRQEWAELMPPEVELLLPRGQLIVPPQDPMPPDEAMDYFLDTWSSRLNKAE